MTCILSFMQGLFYVYDGIITGFTINDFVLAALDFGYIPMILIWRKKGFVVYICLFSALLIWVNSRIETYLFNNFSALLCLFIAFMVFPKIKYFCMVGYLVVTAFAFAFDNELNMMYSDYYSVGKKHGYTDYTFYAELAHAWFHDVDAKENKTFHYFFS